MKIRLAKKIRYAHYRKEADPTAYCPYSKGQIEKAERRTYRSWDCDRERRKEQLTVVSFTFDGKNHFTEDFDTRGHVVELQAYAGSNIKHNVGIVVAASHRWKRVSSNHNGYNYTIRRSKNGLFLTAEQTSCFGKHYVYQKRVELGEETKAYLWIMDMWNFIGEQISKEWDEGNRREAMAA